MSTTTRLILVGIAFFISLAAIIVVSEQAWIGMWKYLECRARGGSVTECL